jgi:mRNA interferase MazF
MPSSLSPLKGEIWLVDFEPIIGDEIGKRRPAVVISRKNVGTLDLRIVCPITDWKPRYEDYHWFHELLPLRSNGLTKRSGADSFQCKSVSIDRFIKRIGIMDEEEVEDIIDRLIFCLRRPISL